MKVDGKAWRSIQSERPAVRIIDQTVLPHRFETLLLRSVDDAAEAISAMWVRGAPLIGATAAYGVALAIQQVGAELGLGPQPGQLPGAELGLSAGGARLPAESEEVLSLALDAAVAQLAATRPTAVNLHWALARMRKVLQATAMTAWVDRAWGEADAIAEEDVAINQAIGQHGADLLRQRLDLRVQQALDTASMSSVADRKPLQILTHCNAGWLATVDGGTALAPIYALHDAGVPVHVWVDETRPRNQGASLTAWELSRHGVPCTVIADNAGGLLMMRGQVDACIVGCDRVAANGDVANKIGTYLKALAADAHTIPFFVACPTPTIDHATATGADIPIEARSAREVTHLQGLDAEGAVAEVQVTPSGVSAYNPGFDVTPAALVTALITERGVVAPDRLADLAAAVRLR